MDEYTTSETDDFEDLRRRLAAAGAAPLDPAVAARTQARLSCARPSPRPRIPRKLVLVATTVGFVLGSVGLAAADTLPDSVQEAAHDALAKVGMHVPAGHDRYNDPVVCPGGPYKNHGEYVRTHTDDLDAGATPCGKPVKSTKSGDDATGDQARPDDDETGPPPWAHGKNASKGKSDKAGKDRDDREKTDASDEEGPGDADPDDSQAPSDAPEPSVAPTTIAPSPTAEPDGATTTVATSSATTTSVPE